MHGVNVKGGVLSHLFINAVAKPTSSVPKRIGFVRRFPVDSLVCFMLEIDSLRESRQSS